MSADEHNKKITPTAFTPVSEAPVKISRKGHGRTLLIGAVVGLALIAGAYLFLARSVGFITTPQDAQLHLKGFAIAIGDRYLVLSGNYQVEASAPGYHLLQQEITVDDEQNQDFELQLEKLPGKLQVFVEGDIAADILVDGQSVGRSGELIGDIQPGTRQINVVAERYQSYGLSLEVEGLDITQTLTIALDPAWADISFNSSPPGAAIIVDDEKLGVTPMVAEILEGERLLQVQLPGYKTWQQLVVINAGEDRSLPTVALTEAEGQMQLSSWPAGAAVTVDGAFVGNTPLAVPLTPGTHQLTVFKEGYIEAKRSVSMESGRDEDVSIKLQPELGDIEIRTQIADALLYVDGVLLGRANQNLSLPSRPHSLEVRKNGYATYSTTVIPRPSLAQLIEVKLRTEEEARWDKIPRRITTAAGGNLLLFRPDETFTMGASRREAGRRANEVLRDVSLTRAFYLGEKEVTNGEYRRFQKQHSSGQSTGHTLDNVDQPVVNVTWQQAALFCNWLSRAQNLPPAYSEENGKITGFNPQATGYRLPTEAEWAWAARLRPGSKEALKYPWGMQMNVSGGNYADESARASGRLIVNGYNDGFAVTAPVGQFEANARGLYDLGGNVAEWINDFYSIDLSLSNKVKVNPTGPTGGEFHTIRGASWRHGSVTELRLSFRDYGNDGREDLGFRIARFVE